MRVSVVGEGQRVEESHIGVISYCIWLQIENLATEASTGKGKSLL